MIAMMRRWNASISAGRFRNDTERLEKLFELYTKMVGSKDGNAKGRVRKPSVEAGS